MLIWTGLIVIGMILNLVVAGTAPSPKAIPQ
jgi:hypothetical protein